MNLLKGMKEILTGKRKLSDIWHYLLGNYRYKLYYSRFKFLIRKHIQEQIAFRIQVMNKECYNQGSCVICGCTTTALQMCNKSCDKPCYPEMMNKKEWEQWKRYLFHLDSKGVAWFIDSKDPDKHLRSMEAKKFF